MQWHELLARRGRDNRPALIVPVNPRLSSEHRSLSYAGLYLEAARIATWLGDHGTYAGERIIVVSDNSLENCLLVFGVLLSGATLVPMAPPNAMHRSDRWEETLARVCAECEVRFVLIPSLNSITRKALPPGVTAVGFDAMLSGGSRGCIDRSDDDVNIVQYTSGTASPSRGVELEQRSLFDNLELIGATVNASSRDVGVTWLPLFHDMGLIGNLLFCIYWGMPLVVLPPRTFALNPESWLWALSRFSGTCSAAPNSAYHACATRIGDSRMEGLDLRSWRVAFNGSELIQRSTVEQFANRFAGFGYRPTTMYPVYGLAEHTLAASLPKHGVRPHFDEIGSERLASDGVAEPAAHGERERAVACVGAPLPGQALRIVDPLTMQVVPERVVGEIQLRGGCTMRGYCGAAPGTGLTPDGWLRSGDRGYLVSGNLHVVGRYKHIVKRGGRTLDCAYIEHVLSALPDVRGGGVAAFGSTDANNGCEELVVLVETRAAGAQRDALRNAICAAMIGTGLPAPDLIQFVRPGQIPRTTSGKIRHAAARGAVSSVDH